MIYTGHGFRTVGELVRQGDILITQRGTRKHPGINVSLSWIFIVALVYRTLFSYGCIMLQVKAGRNHSLHALCDGHVRFTSKRTSRTRVRVFMHVEPLKLERKFILSEGSTSS